MTFGEKNALEKGPHSFTKPLSPKVRGFNLWGPFFSVLLLLHLISTSGNKTLISACYKNTLESLERLLSESQETQT